MELRNESGLEFTDIGSEEWRRYTWAEGSTLLIVHPVQLHVSKSGGHRVMDRQGICYYVAAGWLHLQWEVEEGAPHFVK